MRRAVNNRIFVFLLVAIAFGITTRGRLTLTPDAKVFYVPLADAIEHGRLATFATSTQANFTIILLPSLIALLRTISPGHWELLMLAINVCCAAITAVLLVGLVRRVTGSDAAAAIALLFYLFCYDIFFWASRLLTDHIYTAIATYVFVLSIHGVLGADGPQRSRRIKLAIALIAAVITRPVAIVLVPLVPLTEWVYVEKKRSRRALWLLIAGGIAVAVIAHAYFFNDPSRWPLQWMRPKLVEYAAREQRGEVVWDRHETFHRSPATIADHLSIEVDRFARFFQITSSGFSRSHNLIAIAYYAPLFLLALIGIAGRRRSAVVQIALSWIVVTAALSAVTILDFDWRYRLPLMPQIILLAACGADVLIRRRVERPFDDV